MSYLSIHCVGRFLDGSEEVLLEVFAAGRCSDSFTVVEVRDARKYPTVVTGGVQLCILTILPREQMF